MFIPKLIEQICQLTLNKSQNKQTSHNVSYRSYLDLQVTGNYLTTLYVIQGEKSTAVGVFLEESDGNVNLTNHLRLVPRLRMSGAILSPHMFYGVHTDNFSFISSTRICFCLQCRLSILSNTVCNINDLPSNPNEPFWQGITQVTLLHWFCNLSLSSIKYLTVSLKQLSLFYFINLVPERTGCNYETVT